MSDKAAENLCAAIDSLIVGVQMALTDARALVGDERTNHPLAYKLQYCRNYLFEAKSELMDLGVNAIATPKMPPDDPEVPASVTA